MNKAFLIELGQRIARKRKLLGITQVEIAKQFSCSQSTFAAYEAGIRRVPVSLLPQLADTLEMTLNELLAHNPPKNVRKKPGPPSKLERQFQAIQSLPRKEREFVLKMIDNAIKTAA